MSPANTNTCRKRVYGRDRCSAQKYAVQRPYGLLRTVPTISQQTYDVGRECGNRPDLDQAVNRLSVPHIERLHSRSSRAGPHHSWK